MLSAGFNLDSLQLKLRKKSYPGKIPSRNKLFPPFAASL